MSGVDRGTDARRVVVTGLGAVSGWGWGTAPLWRGLDAGGSAIRPIARFAVDGHRTALAAEVPTADAPAMADPTMSRADRFALAAAGEALAQARLSPAADAPVAVSFASCTGAILESEWFFMALCDAAEAAAAAYPATAVARRPWMRQLRTQDYGGPAQQIARRFGCVGPVETVSSACASGGLALASALEWLRDGVVEQVIVGGADSLCQLTHAGFNALRAVSPAPCRPFRADRSGLTLGEGAAALVLETLASARRRGATVRAEVLGAGASCDAHHMTAPQASGAGPAEALIAALDDAAIAPDAVGFVNAHGTGTPRNDVAESAALRQVFGARVADALPLTSTKASVGHLLGAAGAIEALVTVLCLQHGRVHPTPPADAPADRTSDPDLAVDLVVGAPRALDGPSAARIGLSLSLAFGGANAAVVLRGAPDAETEHGG